MNFKGKVGVLGSDIFVKPDHDQKGAVLAYVKKLMESKDDSFLIEIKRKPKAKSNRQRMAVFGIIKAIWQCDNAEILHQQPVPTKEDLDQYYRDFLEAYAYKRPTKAKKGYMVPIGLSDMTTIEASQFIDNLLMHAAMMEGKTLDVSNMLADFFKQHDEFKASLADDPADYHKIGRELTESEWKENHLVSQASGKGGNLHLHHIHTRGARPDLEHRSWNWLRLTADEHAFLHQEGQKAFLKRYPHLKNRFNRADRLAVKG